MALALLPVVAVTVTASAAAELPRFDYGVPLDPQSPWPKFRRDALQHGRSPLPPRDDGRAPWEFRTGKGVFSSPVIGGDGTVYVGSADRTFYAITRDGTLAWKFGSGEVIDSAALLDDGGRVFVPSGDGQLYALDWRTGQRLWTFRADEPSRNDAFINWFEGNVAIGTDGTLYVPNDNFCTYAIGRDRGEQRWCFRTYDQTWSLPAVAPRSGRLFLGNNFAFFRNTFSVDATSGTAIWRAAAGGSVAASPLLTSSDRDGVVIVGAFDGFLRAYDAQHGRERWRVGMRDHLYASPARLSDGTIIQPSTDGSVYAVRPDDGVVRWVFDTIEPIRSSPAVDGADNIYVGTGDGRLLVLNPDGTLRWALQLIDAQRDDLNASPALGADAIVIGGENGGVFSVPYDYCLRVPRDARCEVGTGERLPDDGAVLLYTTQFGRPLREPPRAIEANQPLAFTLLVRRSGDTQLALIGSARLTVAVDPEVRVSVAVSGDRRFLTIIPAQPYAGPAGATLHVRIAGEYVVDLDRDGLRFSGGRVGGRFEQTFEFDVRPHTRAALPLPIPRAPGDPAGVWELYRLAAPLPTILPSYNQIGFDSIHYLIGLVAGDGNRAIAWAVGGRLDGAGDQAEVDPTSRVRFPLVVDYDGGLLTMLNEAGFTIEFNGWPMPFGLFRAATRVGAHGEAVYSPAVNSRATCGKIDFYGDFLRELGYCNPDTDVLEVFGGAELRPWRGGVVPAATGGDVRFSNDHTSVTATFATPSLRVSEHNVGLLLVDATSGNPLPLDYTAATRHRAAADLTLAAVSIDFAPGQVRGRTRAYLMIDTYPAAAADLTLPESVPAWLRLRSAAASAWDTVSRSTARLVRGLMLRVARWWG